MLSDDLRGWLIRCGELATVVTRVLRECSDLCLDYALRYVLISFSLEFKRLCTYLGMESLGECYKLVSNVCGSEFIGKLSSIVSTGELLCKGSYIELNDLMNLSHYITEVYLCMSRSIFNLTVISNHSSRSS